MRKNRNRFAINLFFSLLLLLLLPFLAFIRPFLLLRDEEVAHRDDTREIIDKTSSLHMTG
jgi:hypothetical protein